MARRALAVGLIVTVAAAFVACGSDGSSGPQRPGGFDGDRAFHDLEAQVALGPRPSGSPGASREVGLIRSRLVAAGITRTRLQHPRRNVIATIPGSEPGYVLAGAHYDTKEGIPGFVGANDGASGVAVLLELARALPKHLDGPSLQLVFFDGEEARGNREFTEDGTRGSRQYVRYAATGGKQGSAPIAEIKAMLLYDMVGDCDLQIPLEEFSDPDLYGAFADAASDVSGDGSPEPFTGSADGVLDDHIPFRGAGVAALDLIDFDYGPGPTPGAWWHTRRDTVAHVCADSLDAVGDASLRALPGLGG
jgi:glutaminyl-peptide cyclotransferase